MDARETQFGMNGNRAVGNIMNHGFDGRWRS